VKLMNKLKNKLIKKIKEFKNILIIKF
jgi:hypothetical protein